MGIYPIKDKPERPESRRIYELEENAGEVTKAILITRKEKEEEHGNQG